MDKVLVFNMRIAEEALSKEEVDHLKNMAKKMDIHVDKKIKSK